MGKIETKEKFWQWGKVDTCPKLLLLRNPLIWKVPAQPHRGNPRKQEKQGPHFSSLQPRNWRRGRSQSRNRSTCWCLEDQTEAPSCHSHGKGDIWKSEAFSKWPSNPLCLGKIQEVSRCCIYHLERGAAWLKTPSGVLWVNLENKKSTQSLFSAQLTRGSAGEIYDIPDWSYPFQTLQSLLCEWSQLLLSNTFF